MEKLRDRDGVLGQNTMAKTQLADFEAPMETEIVDSYDDNLDSNKNDRNPSLYFDDGKRSIDFVLAFKVNPHPHVEAENIEKRRVFEGNLELEGLEIERVLKEKEHIYFVKVRCFLYIIFLIIYWIPI